MSYTTWNETALYRNEIWEHILPSRKNAPKSARNFSYFPSAIFSWAVTSP